jgi:cell filamentation protein
MGKVEFQFAAVHLIPKLMQDFEIRYLVPLACHADMDDNDLIESLVVVHIEFILIHPFREGNGRRSRLLAMIMALQAGRPVLDFSWLDKHTDDYFLAVQAGLDNDEPMKAVFRQVLLDTQRDFV